MPKHLILNKSGLILLIIISGTFGENGWINELNFTLTSCNILVLFTHIIHIAGGQLTTWNFAVTCSWWLTGRCSWWDWNIQSFNAFEHGLFLFDIDFDQVSTLFDCTNWSGWWLDGQRCRKRQILRFLIGQSPALQTKIGTWLYAVICTFGNRTGIREFNFFPIRGQFYIFPLVILDDIALQLTVLTLVDWWSWWDGWWGRLIWNFAVINRWNPGWKGVSCFGFQSSDLRDQNLGFFFCLQHYKQHFVEKNKEKFLKIWLTFMNNGALFLVFCCLE